MGKKQGVYDVISILFPLGPPNKQTSQLLTAYRQETNHHLLRNYTIGNVNDPDWIYTKYVGVLQFPSSTYTYR